MDQFSEQHFSNFVFDWHVREGKQGKLLAETSSRRQAELGKFLKGHDTISWLHDIHAGDLVAASTTLKTLAEQGRNSLIYGRNCFWLSEPNFHLFGDWHEQWSNLLRVAIWKFVRAPFFVMFFFYLRQFFIFLARA
jgi:hypothetical protein